MTNKSTSIQNGSSLSGADQSPESTGATQADRLRARARALLDVERYEDALELFTMVAAADPTDDFSSARVVCCLNMLSRYDEAVTAGRAAVAAFPDSPYVCYELGQSLSAVGRHSEALEMIQESVRLDPGWAAWHRGHAWIAAAAGELLVAKAAIERACTLEPNEPRTWDIRGNVALSMGDWPEAVRCGERAVALQPANSMFVHRLGRALESAGRWDDASERYRDALRLDPRNGSSANGLLKLIVRQYAEAGDRDGAMGAIDECVSFYRGLGADDEGTRAEVDSALWAAAGSLTDLRMYAEALSVMDELVARSRSELAHISSGRADSEQVNVCSARLANRLVTRACRLDDLGRHADALAASDEAVALRRKLAAAKPADQIDNLARALRAKARFLAKLDRHAEAAGSAAETVAICRVAAERWPRLRDDLAWALCNLADRSHGAGDSTAAMTAITEAVELWRELYAETKADKHRDLLAGEVSHVADLLVKDGRHAEAIGPIEEAAAMYRQVVAANPRERYWLDSVLETYGTCLAAVGRHAEALVVLDEAIGSLRGQVDGPVKLESVELDDRDPCRKTLAESLEAAAVSLTAFGRTDEAAAAVAEAAVTRASIGG